MANESNSSVVRVHKNTDFTIMSNHHLRNQKLSLKAVGLMSKILSLPCDWNYSIAGLVKICKEGETAVRAALHELFAVRSMRIQNVQLRLQIFILCLLKHKLLCIEFCH